MARRPIKDALKVLIGVVLLGPPIGGVLFVLLTQFVPWIVAGFPGGLFKAGGEIAYTMLAIVPLSYVFGGHTAALAGLALAAYVAWGGRLTVWSCMLAALIYPAVLMLTAYLDSGRSDPETLQAVFGLTALLAGFALAAAAICYFILRNTWLMRDVTRTARNVSSEDNGP